MLQTHDAQAQPIWLATRRIVDYGGSCSQNSKALDQLRIASTPVVPYQTKKEHIVVRYNALVGWW